MLREESARLWLFLKSVGVMDVEKSLELDMGRQGETKLYHNYHDYYYCRCITPKCVLWNYFLDSWLLSTSEQSKPAHPLKHMLVVSHKIDSFVK